ncbi:MAG: SdrD B-like domain-containing protein [Chloroflexota bacterium]
MSRKLCLAVITTLIVASMAVAQTSTGQLCVRAFEDRNGNGTQDPNEPPIVRGLSATLSDDSGVIVDTGLMEASSTASSGTLCFQGLEAGQYRVRVSSADYIATTPNDFTSAVSDSGVPQVLSFGGQIIPIEAPVADTSLSQEARIQRLIAKAVVGGIGALIVMGAMTVIGVLIYFFALRNRQQPRTGTYRPVTQTGAYPVATGTGSYPRATDTGAYPSASNTPATGSQPAVIDDDMPNVRTLEEVQVMYDDDEDDDTNKPTTRIDTDPYNDASDDDFAFDDEDSPYRPPNE